jgi:hypothetical protein
MPTSARSDYPTLFDMQPEGAPLPVAHRPITPGCLLPLPAKACIDTRRAAAILQVTTNTVQKLLRKGLITGFRVCGSNTWSIEYDSVVEFCNRLRVEFHIRDRRPAKLTSGRWRDADLLPFPIADTVTVQDAMRGLSANCVIVHRLCEEGKLESYRFYGHAPWRISKASLFAYADQLKLQVSHRKRR